LCCDRGLRRRHCLLRACKLLLEQVLLLARDDVSLVGEKLRLRQGTQRRPPFRYR
jgi:hypothetical protein